MPERDPVTGRELNGHQKRLRRQARLAVAAKADAAVAADASPTTVIDNNVPVFKALDVNEPPTSVDGVEEWAQILLQRVAAMIRRDGVDAIPTAQVAIAGLRTLPKMRVAASASQQAIEVLAHERGVVVEVGDDEPPCDAMAGPIWAYLRAARLIHTVITGCFVGEAAVFAAELEVLKLLCNFPSGHLIARLVDEVEA